MKPTFIQNTRHFIGMSTDGLPTDGVTGDTAYTIDNQKEYINNEGHWYLKSNGYSSECVITKLTITIGDDVYNGIIEGTTIDVEVPYGTDVTALTPTITKSANSTVSPTTAQDFTDAVTYTATAQDTINQTVYTVTVTVLDEE